LIVSPYPRTAPAGTNWGSYGITRGSQVAYTDGLINTCNLYSFGSVAHPAAYSARVQTTGGYNTWYLPSISELMTLYSNRSATPFSATSSVISGSRVQSSSEYDKNSNSSYDFSTGNIFYISKNDTSNSTIIPVRKYVRTASDPTSALGNGNSTAGFWIGTALDGVSKFIVSPKSTEQTLTWGSNNITRNITNTTDGLANTNALYAFGNTTASGHPAAYWCKTLTTGGYNNWYLPAINELSIVYSAKTIYPNLNANDYIETRTTYHWSSTEGSSTRAWRFNMANGLNDAGGYGVNKNAMYLARAVRRA